MFEDGNDTHQGFVNNLFIRNKIQVGILNVIMMGCLMWVLLWLDETQMSR